MNGLIFNFHIRWNVIHHLTQYISLKFWKITYINHCLFPQSDSFTSESQLGGKLVFHPHGGKNRKNYSFRNDEVRRIDHENQRLLRALSRLSSGSRPNSAAGRKTPKTSCSPVIRPSSSALNRQREQKRIERENLVSFSALSCVSGLLCLWMCLPYSIILLL